MRLLPFLLLIIIACEPIQRPSNPVIVDGGTTEGSKTTRPRNRLNSGKDNASGTTVSISDILSLIEKEYPLTKDNLSSEVSIVPYLDTISRDTLINLTK